MPQFPYYFLALYFGLLVALWLRRRFLVREKSKATSKASHDDSAWWLKPLASREANLATDTAGLTSAEARSRLAEFGQNLFHDRQQQSLFVQFLSRFKNPLVVLLLVASAISALTGEVANFLIISAIVLFSVTLDFVQERRAGKAAESLRQSVSVRATVIRRRQTSGDAGRRRGSRRPRRAIRRRHDPGRRFGAGSARFVRQAGAVDR